MRVIGTVRQVEQPVEREGVLAMVDVLGVERKVSGLDEQPQLFLMNLGLWFLAFGLACPKFAYLISTGQTDIRPL